MRRSCFREGDEKYLHLDHSSQKILLKLTISRIIFQRESVYEEASSSSTPAVEISLLSFFLLAFGGLSEAIIQLFTIKNRNFSHNERREILKRVFPLLRLLRRGKKAHEMFRTETFVDVLLCGDQSKINNECGTETTAARERKKQRLSAVGWRISLAMAVGFNFCNKAFQFQLFSLSFPN